MLVYASNGHGSGHERPCRPLAVNGIVRTHEPYFVKEKGPTNTSEEAAASAAAHKVLITLLPAYATTIDPLHQTILAGFGTTPASDEASSGVNLWQRRSSPGEKMMGLRLP